MRRKAPRELISHWYHLVDNLQASSKEFYVSVEAELKSRQVPDISVSRVEWSESGVFSAKREYLRIERRDLVFDICAAPFGRGFFFSWWLGERPRGCLGMFFAIPIFGAIFEWIFRRVTYYSIDTALMFQESIRATVNDMADTLTTSKGLRVLTELEKKPIMRNF